MIDVSRFGAVLYAKDLNKLASFHSAVLDLSASSRDEDHVLLESSTVDLVILQVPERIAQTIRVTEPPERRHDAAVKLVFFVSSMSETRDAVMVHGGVMDEVPKDWLFHGWHVWDGLDPEGNVIQFRARTPD